ncbi:superoxide dismutase family protein [Sporosarcina limicola]|uniref:Superoxide dismutase [Cu-Zn] n=1 Tax=Sporosarcina limicola TaxID=34101 RepID=A0A927RCS3_9BACL|nr:superoxide dismutase family protein [Sporosarcina limicola]MBE1553007.1 Cu-Zn family superoxide dismutase [Sporosarcina limicola]
MKHKIVLSIMLGALFIAGGCGKSGSKIPVSGENIESVTAPILNTEGNNIGEVILSEAADGVTISIAAEGLPPGVHGVHVHETGVCTPPDFTSAGNHFNPKHKEHGFENPKGFHLGDLPNIEVDAEGKVAAKLTTKEFTLKPGAANSILDTDGSAVVIHAQADDYKTDPSGNSGARIACAAIGK